jgi:hypothetical protein
MFGGGMGSSLAAMGDTKIAVGSRGQAYVFNLLPLLQNVNDLVTFEPDTSTYTFTLNTDGCHVGAVGKFTFDATLTNISEKELSNLFVEVDELTNANLLLTDNGLIGENERFEIPKINDYDDGYLSADEYVDVPFTVCLKNTKPFRFFVNVLGNADVAKEKIRIEALIDGRSQLILSENTAQWHHLDFAAPGRHEFRDEPTVINGVDWFPVWPDIPNEENRDCDCFSDVFEEVDPPLPFAETNIVLKTIRSRNVTKIIQYPTNENDFELIIEFDDNAPGGSDDYIVEIELEFTPVEP